MRKAGDIGLEDVEKSVRGALDEAKQYEDMILSDDDTRKPRPAPATRRVAGEQENASEPSEEGDQSTPEPSPQGTEQSHPDDHENHQDDDRQRIRDWEPPEKPGYDPHAMIRKGSQTTENSDSGTPETPKDKPERDS